MLQEAESHVQGSTQLEQYGATLYINAEGNTSTHVIGSDNSTVLTCVIECHYREFSDKRPRSFATRSATCVDNQQFKFKNFHDKHYKIDVYNNSIKPQTQIFQR